MSDEKTARDTARALDQFYTRPDVARACLEELRARLAGLAPALWLEPSAGAGAFFSLLPEPRRGLDLEPRAEGVERGDFLAWSPPETDGPIVTVGNPPFGKNASLALRFFNWAAAFSSHIAFIVPRTFEKESLQRRLDRRFWLVGQTVLAPESFEFEGRPYAVPCVFQIWERRAVERVHAKAVLDHPDFAFVPRAQADFAFQRVGVRAGACSRDAAGKAPPSHYFLRDLSADGRTLERLAAIDWTPIKERTAGNPSIGKAELVAAYTEAHGR